MCAYTNSAYIAAFNNNGIDINSIPSETLVFVQDLGRYALDTDAKDHDNTLFPKSSQSHFNSKSKRCCGN